MRVVVFLAAALVFAGSAAAKPKPLVIVALAGQSNMAGNGQEIPPERPLPDVYDATFGKLRPAVDPLGDATGYGPGRAIGAELHRLMPHNRIGLVMCAKGASLLAEWENAGGLYQRCLQRIALAKQNLGGTIAGFLFAQGESDAASPADWQTWGSRFVAMLAALRTDLHAPQLPVVFAQLGRVPTKDHEWYEAGWTSIQQQQAAITLPHTTMIATGDVPSDLHYEWDGYQVLGKRFADRLVQTLTTRTKPGR